MDDSFTYPGPSTSQFRATSTSMPLRNLDVDPNQPVNMYGVPIALETTQMDQNEFVNEPARNVSIHRGR